MSRIDNKNFVELIEEDGTRYVINKRQITYLDEFDDDGSCTINIVGDEYQPIDAQATAQLLQSLARE